MSGFYHLSTYEYLLPYWPLTWIRLTLNSWAPPGAREAPPNGRGAPRV
jgi:hypothetical protein